VADREAAAVIPAAVAVRAADIQFLRFRRMAAGRESFTIRRDQTEGFRLEVTTDRPSRELLYKLRTNGEAFPTGSASESFESYFGPILSFAFTA